MMSPSEGAAARIRRERRRAHEEGSILCEGRRIEVLLELGHALAEGGDADNGHGHPARAMYHMYAL